MFDPLSYVSRECVCNNVTRPKVPNCMHAFLNFAVLRLVARRLFSHWLSAATLHLPRGHEIGRGLPAVCMGAGALEDGIGNFDVVLLFGFFFVKA